MDGKIIGISEVDMISDSYWSYLSTIAEEEKKVEMQLSDSKNEKLYYFSEEEKQNEQGAS